MALNILFIYFRPTLLSLSWGIKRWSLFGTGFMDIPKSVKIVFAVTGPMYVLLVSKSKRRERCIVCRSDYSIQCYESEWLAFQPFVMLVLGTFTIGFPLLLSIMFFRFRNKLYKREVYAKMGFLLAKITSNLNDCFSDVFSSLNF